MQHPELKCPICSGPMEIVHNGRNSWRVSCMANDVFDGHLPPPCSQEDVWGEIESEAVANFLKSTQMTNRTFEFIAELPPGYDDRTTLILGPGNTIVVAHPEQPVLYLHEATMQWCVLDMHISEVKNARKKD